MPAPAAGPPGPPAPLPLRFAAAMAALAPAGGGAGTAHRFVLGVSGGGDSIALLYLARRWCPGAGALLAVTVDHGLRPAAAAEAAKVAAWCAALGVPHRTLRGELPLPAAGLQAAARRLRYRLLARAAGEAGAAHILVAHTMDDQAETVLMRRRRGSGPVGLGGMAPWLRRLDLPGAPVILRPLLQVSGDQLRHWLRMQGLDWIEDPSNRDRRFERVRVREALRAREVAGRPAGQAAPAPAPLLLRLEREAARMRQAAAALDAAAEALVSVALEVSPHGFERLSLAPLQAADPATARHALRRLLAAAGPGAYPPRQAGIDRLWQALQQGVAGATLAGCRLLRAGDGRYLLLRDRRAPLPGLALSPGGLQADWAGRFRVRAEAWLRPGLVLRELGDIGLRRAGRVVADGAALQSVPAAARPGVPAVFADGALVALPTLDCGPAAVPVVLTRLPALAPTGRPRPAPRRRGGDCDAMQWPNPHSRARGRPGSACSERRGVLSTGMPA